jgi:hypothetical protein
MNEMNPNNFIWIDALEKPLSNGENRSFLSCTYHELFKKYPPAFFFEMGSSTFEFQFNLNFGSSFVYLYQVYLRNKYLTLHQSGCSKPPISNNPKSAREPFVRARHVGVHSCA